MDKGSNELPMMAHQMPPAPDTRAERTPMAHKKQPLSRRIQIGLAKLGLIAAASTGVAHHAGIGGPVGDIGTIPDAVGSAAVEAGINTVGFAAKTGGDLAVTIENGIVKLANSEPQQEQKNIEDEKAAVEALFNSSGFQADGQIEIDLANLSQARTQEMLLAARLGNDYERIDPSKITAVGNLPAEPGAKFTVDNPTVYGNSLERDFLATIKTNDSILTVLIPEKYVTITKSGELKPLTAITDTTPLDVVHRISPIQ